MHLWLWWTDAEKIIVWLQSSHNIHDPRTDVLSYFRHVRIYHPIENCRIANALDDIWIWWTIYILLVTSTIFLQDLELGFFLKVLCQSVFLLPPFRGNYHNLVAAKWAARVRIMWEPWKKSWFHNGPHGFTCGAEKGTLILAGSFNLRYHEERLDSSFPTWNMAYCGHVAK